MLTAQHVYFSQNAPAYHHKITGKLMMDGVPYVGNIQVMNPEAIMYMIGLQTKDGLFNFSRLAEVYSSKSLTIMVLKEGRPFSTELIKPDNVVTYDLAISTTGGSAPTGNPGTISGKVERILDGQAQPAGRTLVAVENKPDGSWGVTGNTASDGSTGKYTLDVLTDGGETFVVAMDDYGRAFTPNASVKLNEIIHPTTPNGFVYRVEQAGTLPDTEPQWWIDTGTNHTKTVNDVTLRAMAFYRPLCHGPVIAELS